MSDIVTVPPKPRGYPSQPSPPVDNVQPPAFSLPESAHAESGTMGTTNGSVWKQSNITVSLFTT